MDTFIGILELIAWGASVILLAAGITYAVIRLFPTREDKADAEKAQDATG